MWWVLVTLWNSSLIPYMLDNIECIIPGWLQWKRSVLAVRYICGCLMEVWLSGKQFVFMKVVEHLIHLQGSKYTAGFHYVLYWTIIWSLLLTLWVRTITIICMRIFLVLFHLLVFIAWWLTLVGFSFNWFKGTAQHICMHSIFPTLARTLYSRTLASA